MDSRNSKIAIYGTGNNARLLLEYGESVKYSCVIDEKFYGKSFCGYPVVTLEEALSLSNAILIAAVPVSTAIIYNRIKDRIPKDMPVYDMRGHYLNENITFKEYIVRYAKTDDDKKYLKKLDSIGEFENGKFQMKSCTAVAYVLVPITVCFMKYIMLLSKDYEYFFFPSRDGFFLNELYEIYKRNTENKMAENIYFYTSRYAVKNIDNNYRKYIEKLNKNGRCAVIDIVTQGTVVHGLSELLKRKIDLIAMGTTELPNQFIYDMASVHSMLGQVNEKKGDIQYSLDDFSELHLFLELLYASTEGQFVKIDNEGGYLFREHDYNTELLECVQSELKNIILQNKQLESYEFSYEFAKAMLRLFYRKFSDYREDIKDKFTFDDPYDERMRECNLIERLGW